MRRRYQRLVASLEAEKRQLSLCGAQTLRRPPRHVRWRRIFSLVGRKTCAPRNAGTPLGRRAAETRAVTDLTDVGIWPACDVRHHPKTPAQNTFTSHSLTTERREAEAFDPSTHPGTQLEDVPETLGNPGESFWMEVMEANCSGLLQM